MKDEAFWQAAEDLERDFAGDCDEKAFRRKMKNLGFDKETINERVTAIKEERHW